MAADPIAALDHLLVEDPEHPDLGEAMAVAGDLLQSRGHPRGQLIAFELMQRAAAPGERKAIAATLESWVADHEARIFGSLHALRHRRGALRYAFTGGWLTELALDARRVSPADARYSLDASELIMVLVGSPALRRVRSLQIRAAKFDELVRLSAELRKQVRADKTAIESLILSPTTRPIGHRANATPVELDALRRAMPKLWCVTESGYLVSLLDPRLPDEASADELDRLRGGAMSRDLRVLIGRGLTSGRPETTKVACEHIAEQGASGRVFLPTLRMLLRPQVSHAAVWIAPMLVRFGAWVHELRPQLASITGSDSRFSVELRRAAGLALRQLDLHHR